MSVIAASRLSAYLDDETAVLVCHADGTIWKSLFGPAVQVLADKRMITGRGSQARLKCVILSASSDKAEEEIDRARQANKIKGRLQASEASKTGMWDKWSNHIGTVISYKHIRTQAFSPAGRLFV